MKAVLTLLLAPFFLPLTHAGPTPHTPHVLISPRGECRRDLETVTSFTEKLFTGNAKLTYSISGTGAAYSTCKIVNHYANTEHPCTWLSALLASLLAAAIQASTSPDTGRDGTQSGAKRRQLQILGPELLTNLFDTQGFNWDKIDTSPGIDTGRVLDSSYHVNNSDNVLEHYIIRGVVHPNISIPAADIHYTSFVNGTGFIQSRHNVLLPADGGSGSGTLQRRHDGAGFKINWRVFTWRGAAWSDPQSAQDATRPVAIRLGQGIANHWSYSADYFMLDEWIGVAGMNYILAKIMALGLRIIPELQGFGENYEDVGVCGPLDQIAHDELKL